MNKHELICPVCGSKNINRHEKIKADHVTLGPEFTYKDIYYSCNDCKEEIDILGETDQNYQVAQKEAQKIFAQQAIEYINSRGISMALFERVFELPTRTLTRWKEGNFSSSAMSLLQIVVTFPWIINVAENRFNPELAKRELIYAATNKFFECAANLETNLEIEVKTGNTVFAKINCHNKDNMQMQPKITINEAVRAS